MKNLLLLLLAMSLPLFAQTTNTFSASTGYVSPGDAVTGDLNGGGAFHSPYGMGAGCYYGGCPAWQFSNYPLSYILPDGTTASFTNFAGAANFSTQDVHVQGTASGTDSTGSPVSIAIEWEWIASCRSGRGGGCTKKFVQGELSITK
jgi:hypothetical protein